jgi:cyclic pyranopterin phosphate synthase
MCHPLSLSSVRVRVDELPDGTGMSVLAEVATTGPTGVEMEALTAVSVACLTVYDMLKAVDRSMRIEAVRLTAKSGGASGDFRAEQDDY